MCGDKASVVVTNHACSHCVLTVAVAVFADKHEPIAVLYEPPIKSDVVHLLVKNRGCV